MIIIFIIRYSKSKCCLAQRRSNTSRYNRFLPSSNRVVVQGRDDYWLFSWYDVKSAGLNKLCYTCYRAPLSVFPIREGTSVLGRRIHISFNLVRRYHSSNNPRNWRSFLCLQSSRGFAVQERGLKGQSRRNFDAVNNAQRRKHFRSLFLLRQQSQKRKRWGNTQTYPLNMLINELESSYWWNSGWHCKKMVSYFVSKSI